MKKRIFSMLLALCMVVSMLPLGSIRAKATVTDAPENSGTDAQQTGDVGEIIVGEGTDTSRSGRIPLQNYYKYSAVQYVIPASELEDVAGKVLFSFIYYYDDSNVVSNTRDLEIYLQEVEGLTLNGFTDTDQSSQVFSGTAALGNGELPIDLDTPYLYLGKDLLVTVIDSTGVDVGPTYFYGTSELGNAVCAYNDNVPYDLGALGSGNNENFTPKMKIVTADSVTYSITVGDCENGTVSANREIACAGQTVVLEAIPAEGYCLRAFTVLCGEETVEVSEDGIFVMPDGDVTVTAEFQKLDRYSITVNEAANGTVTAAEAAYVTNTVTLQVTPAEGYTLESLAAENNDTLVFTKVNDSTYTFVMPAENVTIMPTFVEKSTVVLELADTYGDGWSNNAIRVFLDGSETPLTEDITLASGAEGTYTLNVPKNAILDFCWIKGSYAYECSFTIIRDGHKVFEALPGSMRDVETGTVLYSGGPVVAYGVTVNTPDNGTVTAPESFAAGVQLTLGITPDAGYILDSLTVTCSDGTPVEVDQNYTFTMPESDISITAVFRALGIYNITVIKSGHGTVTVAEVCRETERVSMTVSPAVGYVLESLAVMQGETPLEVGEDNTFIMPAGDVTVVATFKVNPHIAEHGRAGCEIVWFNGFSCQEEWNEIDTLDADGDGFNWEWKADSDAHQNMCLKSCSYITGDGQSSKLTPDNWLITPVLELEEGLGYEFSIMARTHSENYPDMFGVFVTTDVEGEIDASTLQQIGTDITPPETLTEYAFDLTEYAGQNIRVVIRHYNTYNMYALFVDCLCLYACDAARYEITCNETPYGTVTVDRETAMAGQTVKITTVPKRGYRLESITVMQGENQVALSNTDSFIMPAGDVTVTGVFATDPHIAVHRKDGQELIWFNSFQTSEEINEMMSWDVDGDTHPWYLDKKNPGHEGQYLLSMAYYGAQDLDPDDWLIMPVFQLDANNTYQLALTARRQNERYPDTFGVFFTTDVETEITKDTPLEQLGENITPPSDWTEYVFDLSEYAGQNIRIIIRHYDSYGGFGLDVDCLSLYQGVYSVTVNSGENGTVTADKTTAKGGETVALTVTPDAGYVLESLTVMQGETPVEVGEDYTFVMPTGDVTVSAQWAEMPVAKIAETGVEYTSLTTALETAMRDAMAAGSENQTVMLLTDITWSGLVMYANLDLNGHVLTVDNHMVVFDDSQILDSSESNSGLLVLEVAQKYLVLQNNNRQLPVYGSRIGVEDSRKGYAFVEVEKFNRAIRADKGDFVFQPVLESAAVAMLAENLDESRLKVVVQVAWENDKGEARTQAFLYSNTLLQSFLNSYDAAGNRFGNMFTLKLKVDNLEPYSFRVMMVSDMGVTIASEPISSAE